MADEVTIRVVRSFQEISSTEWGLLSGACRSGPGYNPFTSHAFLSAIEDSGSATAETGWMGHHLLLEEEGRLIGAIPCYLKSHSQGEYVFDHGWADAFQRAGGRYYPKLQASIPFTPATGPRLLVRQGEDVMRVQSLLAQGLRQVAQELNISSAHITFLTQGELASVTEASFLHRTDQQFHFINRGYANHEAFLAELSSSKRKNLRRERRSALENGLSIDWLTGSDLTEEIWDQFFHFYVDTGSRKWGRPYLTRLFYSLVGERMSDDVLLVTLNALRLAR